MDCPRLVVSLLVGLALLGCHRSKGKLARGAINGTIEIDPGAAAGSLIGPASADREPNSDALSAAALALDATGSSITGEVGAPADALDVYRLATQRGGWWRWTARADAGVAFDLWLLAGGRTPPRPISRTTAADGPFDVFIGNGDQLLLAASATEPHRYRVDLVPIDRATAHPPARPPVEDRLWPGAGSVVGDEVLVRLDGLAPAALERLGLTHRAGLGRWHRYRTPVRSLGVHALADLLDSIRRSAGVRAAEPNRVVAGLQHALLGAAERPATGRPTPRRPRIAIVGGRIAEHPYLAGRVLAPRDMLDDAPPPTGIAEAAPAGATAMAGIAVSRAGADVAPIRVLSDGGVGHTWAVARGIRAASITPRDPTIAGVDVICLGTSGAGAARVVHDAVLEALRAGVTVVAGEPLQLAVHAPDDGLPAASCRVEPESGAGFALFGGPAVSCAARAAALARARTADDHTNLKLAAPAVDIVEPGPVEVDVYSIDDNPIDNLEAIVVEGGEYLLADVEPKTTPATVTVRVNEARLPPEFVFGKVMVGPAGGEKETLDVVFEAPDYVQNSLRVEVRYHDSVSFAVATNGTANSCTLDDRKYRCAISIPDLLEGPVWLRIVLERNGDDTITSYDWTSTLRRVVVTPGDRPSEFSVAFKIPE